MKIRLQQHKQQLMMCLYVELSINHSKQTAFLVLLHGLLTRSVELTSPDTISGSRILHTRVVGLLCEHPRIFPCVDPDLLAHLIQCDSHPRSACGRGSGETLTNSASAWSEFKNYFLLFTYQYFKVYYMKYLLTSKYFKVSQCRYCFSDQTYSHVIPVTFLHDSHDGWTNHNRSLWLLIHDF